MPIIDKLRAVLILLIIPFLVGLVKDIIFVLNISRRSLTMIVSTLLTNIILIWIKLNQFFTVGRMT